MTEAKKPVDWFSMVDQRKKDTGAGPAEGNQRSFHIRQAAHRDFQEGKGSDVKEADQEKENEQEQSLGLVNDKKAEHPEPDCADQRQVKIKAALLKVDLARQGINEKNRQGTKRSAQVRLGQVLVKTDPQAEHEAGAGNPEVFEQEHGFRELNEKPGLPGYLPGRDNSCLFYISYRLGHFPGSLPSARGLSSGRDGLAGAMKKDRSPGFR